MGLLLGRLSLLRLGRRTQLRPRKRCHGGSRRSRLRAEGVRAALQGQIDNLGPLLDDAAMAGAMVVAVGASAAPPAQDGGRETLAVELEAVGFTAVAPSEAGGLIPDSSDDVAGERNDGHLGGIGLPYDTLADVMGVNPGDSRVDSGKGSSRRIVPAFGCWRRD